MAIEVQHWYGSPKWTITTGTGAGLSGGGGNTWYPLVFGGIFGTDFGWVPWAPIGVLALAATGCLLIEAPRWATYALLVIAVYQLELAISGLPSPGFVFPGRYEISASRCSASPSWSCSRAPGDVAGVHPADARDDPDLVAGLRTGHPTCSTRARSAWGRPRTSRAPSRTSSPTRRPRSRSSPTDRAWPARRPARPRRKVRRAGRPTAWATSPPGTHPAQPGRLRHAFHHHPDRRAGASRSSSCRSSRSTRTR